jgi:DNA-binding transcriptional MerR regulator
VADATTRGPAGAHAGAREGEPHRPPGRGGHTEQAGQARQWRIDDLAREAGVTVDTIRYYAREGLLSRPERVGRHMVYGPRHLDRLRRIRELQDRRFSLAAIKAILETEMPGVEEIFTGAGRSYTFDELVAGAGLDPAFLDRLRRVGVLPDPEEFGRDAYDAADAGMLEAAAELLDIGMPPELLVELGRIYVTRFRQLQRDVVDLLSGAGAIAADGEELETLQRRLTAESGRLVPAASRVLHYVHLRTLQRITLERLRETAHERHGTGAGPRAPGSGAGGRSLD